VLGVAVLEDAQEAQRAIDGRNEVSHAVLYAERRFI
jgi:hypothetical protein